MWKTHKKKYASKIDVTVLKVNKLHVLYVKS